jgi:thioredoxin 1
MANVQELTDQDFDTAVQAGSTPALVDFSATWCQPCKALAPTIDAVAKEYEGRLRVYKVDIDHAPNSAGHFGITGVPTCVFFRDGKEVDRFSGALDLRSVRGRVDKVLAAARGEAS